MSSVTEVIDAPLSPQQLAERWRALCADATFEDVPGKVELTEWGEILMSPVGKTHGLIVMRIAEALKRGLGGHTMAEVGIVTSIGVRAPDVAWCSDQYLQQHPEESPLERAPEICVEVASSSNPLPKLREKAGAYVRAGAVEAWIVVPARVETEIYGLEGRRPVSEFRVDLQGIFLSQS